MFLILIQNMVPDIEIKDVKIHSKKSEFWRNFYIIRILIL